MKTIKALFILLCLSTSTLAYSSDLDQYISRIKKESSINPFNIGEAEALKHPIYKKLHLLSKKYGSVIEWKESVSKRVLELPYSPYRMKVTVQDEFDGWFDEFTHPNLIIIHQEASLVTLVHELRHALHLGQHEMIAGNWFDNEIQKNKIKIYKFQKKLKDNKSNLNQTEVLKLIKQSTRLLETCSEISAHEGDLDLAREFDPSVVEHHKELIQGYRKEFNRAFNFLIKNPNSLNESFVRELKTSLDLFIKEKNYKKSP